MIKRVEPLTERHPKKSNSSYSASWAFVVGYPACVVVAVVAVSVSVAVVLLCLLLMLFSLLLVDNVVIYDNFIVLSTCCPFYFRLCLLLIYYHTPTPS